MACCIVLSSAAVCVIELCCVVFCFGVLCRFAFCSFMLCCLLLCWFMLCCTMSCHVMSCCVVLCWFDVMSCCGVLCRVVFCCTLCYAIVLPGRKSVSGTKSGSDCSVDGYKIGPPAVRKADVEAFPIRIRPKSGPEARVPDCKNSCVTSGIVLCYVLLVLRGLR